MRKESAGGVGGAADARGVRERGGTRWFLTNEIWFLIPSFPNPEFSNVVRSIGVTCLYYHGVTILRTIRRWNHEGKDVKVTVPHMNDYEFYL